MPRTGAAECVAVGCLWAETMLRILSCLEFFCTTQISSHLMQVGGGTIDKNGFCDKTDAEAAALVRIVDIYGCYLQHVVRVPLKLV